MQNVWVHRLAILNAACTFLTITAGALLTTAGTSPTAFALHRGIGGTCALLTLILAVLLRKAAPKTNLLAWMTFALMLLEGALGSLRNASGGVQVVHAAGAQVAFALTVALALLTAEIISRAPQTVHDGGWPSLRSISLVTISLVLIQVTLGAAFRHHLIGVLPHAGLALIVAGMILLLGIFTLTQFPTHAELRPAALTLLGITLVQVMLGVGALMGRMGQADGAAPGLDLLLLATGHAATGALTTGATVALSILVYRNVNSPATQLTSTAEAAL